MHGKDSINVSERVYGMYVLMVSKPMIFYFKLY